MLAPQVSFVLCRPAGGGEGAGGGGAAAEDALWPQGRGQAEDQFRPPDIAASAERAVAAAAGGGGRRRLTESPPPHVREIPDKKEKR